jgi:hypothetical protein
MESPLERQRLIQGAKNWGGSKKAEPKGKTHSGGTSGLYKKRGIFIYTTHNLCGVYVVSLSLYNTFFYVVQWLVLE